MKGGKVFLFEFADDVEAFLDQNIDGIQKLNEAVGVIGLQPSSQIKLKSIGVDAYNTLPFFGQKGHENVLDASEKMINTIFNIEIDGIQTAFFGRPSSKFNDSTIRELGKVDVLIIQSNNQFLDMDQIAYAIREIEPKIVIFSNFGSKETISPDLQNLISELGSQNTTIVNKITLSKSNITENRQIIVLDENSS